MASTFTSGVMDPSANQEQNGYVGYKKTFIREWRNHRGLTLERLAERLGGFTAGSLSRIERGLQPYNQGLLEALGVALSCEPADLLAKNPQAVDFELWTVISRLDEPKRRQALKLIRAALVDDEAAD